MGLISWLFDSNTAPGYDTAKVTKVDPRKVRWADTPVDRRAVERYKRNPNRASDDGDPYVVRTRSGQLVGWNGKHRGVAAMETGRMLRVRVQDEANTRETGRGWW